MKSSECFLLVLQEKNIYLPNEILQQIYYPLGWSEPTFDEEILNFLDDPYISYAQKIAYFQWRESGRFFVELYRKALHQDELIPIFKSRNIECWRQIDFDHFNLISRENFIENPLLRNFLLSEEIFPRLLQAKYFGLCWKLILLENSERHFVILTEQEIFCPGSFFEWIFFAETSFENNRNFVRRYLDYFSSLPRRDEDFHKDEQQIVSAIVRLGHLEDFQYAHKCGLKITTATNDIIFFDRIQMLEYLSQYFVRTHSTIGIVPLAIRQRSLHCLRYCFSNGYLCMSTDYEYFFRSPFVRCDEIFRECINHTKIFLSQAIIYPCITGDLDLFDEMVQKGVPMGCGMINTCIDYGHFTMAAILIARGYQIDLTTLRCAITAKQIDLIRMIIEGGISPSSISLSHAIYSQNTEILQLCWHEKRIGKDELIAAIEVGNLALFEKLEKLVVPNKSNQFLITTACRQGNLSTVKYLLEKGYRFSSVDSRRAAILADSLEILKYLDEINHENSSHVLEQAALSRNFRCFEYLLHKGYELSYDVVHNSFAEPQIWRLLLQQERIPMNRVTMYYAIKENNIELADLLIKRGVQYNLFDVASATKMRYYDLARYLQEKEFA